MSKLNTFQALARKKLVSLSADLVMRDDQFAKKLALLMRDHGCNKEDLIDILKDIMENEVHNNVEEKTKQYVYSRFELFDENLNGLRRGKNLMLAH